MGRSTGGLHKLKRLHPISTMEAPLVSCKYEDGDGDEDEDGDGDEDEDEDEDHLT